MTTQQHEDLLLKGNREIDVRLARHEIDYQKLRAELVAELGEEQVRKLEEEAHAEY